jgi:hypothetical protein
MSRDHILLSIFERKTAFSAIYRPKKTLTSTAQLLMPCVGKNENPAPPFIG